VRSLVALLLFAAPLAAQVAPPGVVVAPRGGVQAPDQPSGRSSATYERGERFAPEPGRGASESVRARVGALVDVRGQEDNALTGVGLVTGLAGTGDSINMARQLVENLLLTKDIRIDAQLLTPKNVAVVLVEATLPAGLQAGRRVDVRVSALGDAKSLQGGTLLFTSLEDPGGVVWASASGPVDVGGFRVEGAAATVAKNHVTVGTIAGGGKVERSLPSEIVTEHGYLYLDARAAHGSYANLVRIVDAIERVFPGAAEAATDGRAVKVRVPSDLPRASYVAYLDAILRLEIEPESTPRVVVNERTGTIVIGEGVRLRPGAVAIGGLTVRIAETPEVSQPGPLSGGATREVPRTDLAVEEDSRALVEVRAAVALDEVVEVLNVLGATPRELISVLEAMNQSGLLLAEVVRL
jgi:flagellar P-ring protein precursor FlgI